MLLSLVVVILQLQKRSFVGIDENELDGVIVVVIVVGVGVVNVIDVIVVVCSARILRARDAYGGDVWMCISQQ